SVAILVRNRVRGHSYANLHLLQRLFVAQNDARNYLRSRSVKAIRSRRHVLEMLVHHFHEMLVFQAPGGANDDIAGNKSLLVNMGNRFLLEPLHRVFGAKYGPAQRMVLPEILREYFVD